MSCWRTSTSTRTAAAVSTRAAPTGTTGPAGCPSGRAARAVDVRGQRAGGAPPVHRPGRRCGSVRGQRPASSVVARVGLIAADVTGAAAVGALAGRNGGRVTAVWVTGRVSGTESAGGLARSNAGEIGGSYAAAVVSGERQAGGVVGVNEGSLVAAYSTGGVSGTAAVGGLVGFKPRDADGKLRRGARARRERGRRPGGCGERAGEGDGRAWSRARRAGA